MQDKPGAEQRPETAGVPAGDEFAAQGSQAGQVSQSQSQKISYGRKTNWWALGVLAAVGLTGVALIKSRAAATVTEKPSRQQWIDLHEMAGQCRGRGRFAEALQAGLAAARLAPQAYGPEHFAVAESLNLLGLIYTDTARYSEALAAYEQALPILQTIFGPGSREVALAGSNLGLTLMRLGEYDEARPIFEKAVEITENATGLESLETAVAINNLALLLDTSGDHAAAKPVHERALGIRRRALGPADPRTAESMANLAWNIAQTIDKMPASDRAENEPAVQKQLQDAERLYDQAVAVRSRLLPPDSLELAATLAGAAAIARESGRLPAAGRLALEALAIRQAKLGGSHPTTAASYETLARVRSAAGEPEEAAEFYTLATEVRMKSLGPKHPKTLDSLAALATFHIDHNDLESAEKPLRTIIEIREKIDGATATSLADPLERLADVLEATDRGDEGEQVRARAKAIREKSTDTDNVEKPGSVPRAGDGEVNLENRGA